MTGRFVPPDEDARHVLWTEIVAAIRKFEQCSPNVRVARLNIMRYMNRGETLQGVEIVTRNLS
jgi:hypothetical protein